MQDPVLGGRVGAERSGPPAAVCKKKWSVMRLDLKGSYLKLFKQIMIIIVDEVAKSFTEERGQIQLDGDISFRTFRAIREQGNYLKSDRLDSETFVSELLKRRAASFCDTSKHSGSQGYTGTPAAQAPERGLTSGPVGRKGCSARWKC